MDAYNAVFKPLENRRAFQILPMLLHPRSKGYMKLKSRNPFHHPLFYPNFFADRRDIETLLQGIRETIKITEQPAFKSLGVKLYKAKVPGCEKTIFNTDDYWRCYIRHLSATLHHQIGRIYASGIRPDREQKYIQFLLSRLFVCHFVNNIHIHLLLFGQFLYYFC